MCVVEEMVDSKAVRKLLAKTHYRKDIMLQLKSQNLPGAVKGSHMRTSKTTQLYLRGLVILIRVDVDIVRSVFLPCDECGLCDVEVEDLYRVRKMHAPLSSSRHREAPPRTRSSLSIIIWTRSRNGAKGSYCNHTRSYFLKP
jgi:hypothetical protein